MTLPLRTLPILEQWDCHACGLCCKGHTVLLDADDLKRIREQQWEQRSEFQGQPIVTPIGVFSRQYALSQRKDGSCVFLLPDGKCQIHKELGEPAKPWPCRAFPYQFLPAGDHIRLTMRRNCPSAAADKGRPLTEQIDTARGFVPFALPSAERSRAPYVYRGRRYDWEHTRVLLDAIEAIVLDDTAPMVRRLCIAICLVEHLARGSIDRLETPRMREGLRLLTRSSAEEIATRFGQRPAPTRAGAVLFRQTAGEYLRFHPNLADRPTLLQRIAQMRSAWRLARGVGAVPKIHPDLPSTTFDDLEAPLGPLPAEVMDPLNRYLAALTASQQYCGAGRAGWSIVDGFRALAVIFPTTLWALRWVADGRKPTRADMIDVICQIDRSHYYPLLLGARHRRRLHTLAQTGDLERLLIWYAR